MIKYRILSAFKFANSCGIGPVTPLLSMYLRGEKNKKGGVGWGIIRHLYTVKRTKKKKKK